MALSGAASTADLPPLHQHPWKPTATAIWPRKQTRRDSPVSRGRAPPAPQTAPAPWRPQSRRAPPCCPPAAICNGHNEQYLFFTASTNGGAGTASAARRKPGRPLAWSSACAACSTTSLLGRQEWWGQCREVVWQDVKGTAADALTSRGCQLVRGRRGEAGAARQAGRQAGRHASRQAGRQAGAARQAGEQAGLAGHRGSHRAASSSMRERAMSRRTAWWRYSGCLKATRDWERCSGAAGTGGMESWWATWGQVRSCGAGNAARGLRTIVPLKKTVFFAKIKDSLPGPEAPARALPCQSSACSGAGGRGPAALGQSRSHGPLLHVVDGTRSVGWKARCMERSATRTSSCNARPPCMRRPARSQAVPCVKISPSIMFSAGTRTPSNVTSAWP